MIQLVGVRGGDRLLAQVGGDADEPVNEGAHWRARLSPELANYSDYPPSDPAPHYSNTAVPGARLALHRPSAGLHQIGGKNDLIVICGPAGALINHTAG